MSSESLAASSTPRPVDVFRRDAEGDVLGDGAVAEENDLRDMRDVALPSLAGVLAERDAIHRQAAARGAEQPHDNVDQRALAAARCTHEADPRALLYLQVDVAKHRLACMIGELEPAQRQAVLERQGLGAVIVAAACQASANFMTAS